MKLWLLRAKEDLPEDDNPWIPDWDKTFGFVIRAVTEEEARGLANVLGGEENPEGMYQIGSHNKVGPWLDPRYSTCTELTAEGPPGFIIQDHRST